MMSYSWATASAIVSALLQNAAAFPLNGSTSIAQSTPLSSTLCTPILSTPLSLSHVSASTAQLDFDRDVLYLVDKSAAVDLELDLAKRTASVVAQAFHGGLVISTTIVPPTISAKVPTITATPLRNYS
jgi:hypothetical protein